MGRAVLKTLKQTTLLTFFDICKEWNLTLLFKYNAIEGVITWFNGSTIYLKDLFAYPSDPEFDSLGSTEFTLGFIDEASQITVKAFNIVKSRIRYKLDKYHLIPKILVATNPYKNFLYTDFYKPYRDGILPSYRVFLPSLVTDNPYISQHYIDNLHKIDKNSMQRLLYGNWEYDDDPTRLFEYEDLVDMFSNEPDKKSKGKYLTCDVARFGKDLTVIIYWKGLHIAGIWSFSKQDTRETVKKLKQLARKYRVQHSHIIIDEDGLGGGVVDNIDGVRGFVNNSRPIINKRSRTSPSTTNYTNLKSQCYFWLANYIKDGRLSIYKAIPATTKELILADLEQIKEDQPDRDAKKRVLSKDKIKEMLGRSPDYADAIMMRMLTEVKEDIQFAFISLS